jgi:hypothetical protein
VILQYKKWAERGFFWSNLVPRKAALKIFYRTINLNEQLYVGLQAWFTHAQMPNFASNREKKSLKVCFTNWRIITDLIIKWRENV